MKSLRWLKATLLATASCLAVGVLSPTMAGTFDNAEVNEDNFIAVAAPFGEGKYQLLIIEQRSNQRACWQESGSSPTVVDPLLLNFDFTGICGRSTDSNGYSMRMSGQDLGLDYLLRIVERNGELLLVGTNRMNRRAPEVILGRSGGVSQGNFHKIVLEPNWRLTRRTYQGKALGHLYLTSDTAAPVTPGVSTTPPPLPPAVTREAEPSKPAREFIFTKPDDEPTAPSVEVPTIEVPAGGSQTLPPPPSDRTVPVLGN
ncbi:MULTISPECIES: DUF3747 domain-containing protein [unclassified Coleofasciculus]|uniref:DUF3747 domain-containing protein n=1 Tax=unclassified Coleofasciculus TaxID=2692782 RepID=UPI001880E20F|nr:MULTISPECIES: DUF3747 domain-containing protein [unclassified Coleofasciculus]MBE9128800.1 DUF3747 domain-containing protein [Coleofasciculus sp. LEGE 07081]MBE9151519.1 DUF3747 domain-containing protein [Coleofasciculus sp. LEGE 07092]